MTEMTNVMQSNLQSKHHLVHASRTSCSLKTRPAVSAGRVVSSILCSQKQRRNKTYTCSCRSN
jgi:hypothetical protein